MASNYDYGLQSTTETAVSNATGMRMYDPNKQRVVNNDLGKDEFLKVLVAQMSNQNPLEPTSDTEFIAQMAQFSALEQMQAMNQSTQSQRAYSLIGKEITASTVMGSDGIAYAMEVYGNVTGVSKVDGVEYLVVYDYLNEIEVLVPPSAVRTVFDTVDITTRSQLESIYNLLTKLLESINKLAPAEEVEPEEEDDDDIPPVEDTGGTNSTPDADKTQDEP